MRARALRITTAVLIILAVPTADAVAANGTGGAAVATPKAKPAPAKARRKRSRARHVHSSQAPADSSPSGPATAPSQLATPSNTSTTGGQQYGAGTPNLPATPTVPGLTAKIVNGIAYAPADAPLAVQQAIWAGNRIVGKPYVYGGGHRAFKASGYDCSGTVSYALHGAGLLRSPLDSSSFMGWGDRGDGQWITIYTNSGHAYMQIAGIRLDTSSADDPSGFKGPRWRPLRGSNHGFKRRHPVGF